MIRSRTPSRILRSSLVNAFSFELYKVRTPRRPIELSIGTAMPERMFALIGQCQSGIAAVLFRQINALPFCATTPVIPFPTGTSCDSKGFDSAPPTYLGTSRSPTCE